MSNQENGSLEKRAGETYLEWLARFRQANVDPLGYILDRNREDFLQAAISRAPELNATLWGVDYNPKKGHPIYQHNETGELFMIDLFDPEQKDWRQTVNPEDPQMKGRIKTIDEFLGMNAQNQGNSSDTLRNPNRSS